MPRSLWRGAISFGLIYVPVELHTASKDGAFNLHLLDSRDFAPVGGLQAQIARPDGGHGSTSQRLGVPRREATCLTPVGNSIGTRAR
jgi:hypothetical protein